MVRLRESFFNVLWACNFAQPGQPIVLLRPYRGPRSLILGRCATVRPSTPASPCATSSSASASEPSSRASRSARASSRRNSK
eukprot:4122807-Alexandrium_andersonii.AAC.1